MVSLFGFDAPKDWSGRLMLEHLGALQESDIRRRKYDIQALAEVTALSIIGDFSKDTSLPRLHQYDDRSFRQFQESLWLRDILQTVQSDKEKLTQVDNYLKGTFASLTPSNLESLRKWFKNSVEMESRKIRVLRQSFYYRNRSVNAILAYLKLGVNSDLATKKLTSTNDVLGWFREVNTRFRQHGKGEKFTRNSYLSEWDAFLHDVWPELPIISDYSEEKSLDSKFRIAIQNKANALENSVNSPRAKRLLRKYSSEEVSGSEKGTSSWSSVDVPSIEMKIKKGVGIFANLRFHEASLDYLLRLSSEILMKSLSENKLTGISTEIVKEKSPVLVVKCECQPDAENLKAFEEFVSNLFSLKN